MVRHRRLADRRNQSGSAGGCTVNGSLLASFLNRRQAKCVGCSPESRTKALDSELRCAHPGLSVRPAAAWSDLRVHARASGCGLRPRGPICAYTHAQAGFTLIEVMAAFAIFAVLFGLVLQILSTSISNTRRSGDFTQAALLAQSQLDMVGVESLPEPGHFAGRYNDEYSWEMVIEPYFIEDDRGVMYEELPIDLYYVGLTVYWGEGAAERSVLFETLRSVDRFYAERQEQGR
ncbi:MAG: prepilin-type N-terminal cleavage/methylation domain-containing protein [Wenzhouxiangellaceae bacterium]|nr:prepilin-type N-terminal cleavage/methylation domain-containing protein [Wenzhouxiangellaceae bacterium]